MLDKEKGKIASHFSNGDEKRFKIILISSFIFYLSFALTLNIIRFPERERLNKDIKTIIAPRFAKLILESPKPELEPKPKPKIEKIEPKEPPRIEEKKIEEIKPEKEVKPQIEVKDKPEPEEVIEPKKEEEVRIRLDEEARGIEKERESRIIEEARLRAEEEKRRIKAEAKIKKEDDIKAARNTGLLRLLGKKKKNKDTKGISPAKRKKRLFSVAKELDNTSEDMEIKRRLQKDNVGMVDTQKELAVIGLRKSKDISDLDTDEYLKGTGGIDNIVGGIGESVKGGTLQSKNVAVVKSPFKIKGLKGGRSPRSIQSIADVVNSYKDGITYIYNRALLEHPTLEGIITVEFTITAKGNVISCDIISSGMSYSPLETSLVKQIFQWKFPSIKEGIVTVEYPIRFSPSSG